MRNQPMWVSPHRHLDHLTLTFSAVFRYKSDIAVPTEFESAISSVTGKRHTPICCGTISCERRESNPRHLAYETKLEPLQSTSQYYLVCHSEPTAIQTLWASLSTPFVQEDGLEPTTLCLEGKRSTLELFLRFLVETERFELSRTILSVLLSTRLKYVSI